MTDHAQIMTDKTLAQFCGRPNLEALVRVLGGRLNVIEQVISDLQEKRWIETAETVQLDGCGAIVDQSRLISKAIGVPFFGFRSQTMARGFGRARFRGRYESHLSTAKLGDPAYRKVIKSKVAKNISFGTTEETIASYINIFNADRVIISETGNATMTVDIARKLTEKDLVLIQALDLFVKPGGVGVSLRSYYELGSTFGFRNQGLKGFGSGVFAKRFKEV